MSYTPRAPRNGFIERLTLMSMSLGGHAPASLWRYFWRVAYSSSVGSTERQSSQAATIALSPLTGRSLSTLVFFFLLLLALLASSDFLFPDFGEVGSTIVDLGSFLTRGPKAFCHSLLSVR